MLLFRLNNSAIIFVYAYVLPSLDELAHKRHTSYKIQKINLSVRFATLYLDEVVDLAQDKKSPKRDTRIRVSNGNYMANYTKDSFYPTKAQDYFFLLLVKYSKAEFFQDIKTRDLHEVTNKILNELKEQPLNCYSNIQSLFKFKLDISIDQELEHLVPEAFTLLKNHLFPMQRYLIELISKAELFDKHTAKNLINSESAKLEQKLSDPMLDFFKSYFIDATVAEYFLGNKVRTVVFDIKDICEIDKFTEQNYWLPKMFPVVRDPFDGEYEATATLLAEFYKLKGKDFLESIKTSLANLDASLWDWAKANNLNAQWCVDKAKSLLDAFYFSREIKIEDLNTIPHFTYNYDQETKLLLPNEIFLSRNKSSWDFSFEHPGWDPLFIAESQAREIIKKAFENCLDTYIKCKKEEFNANSKYKPIPRFRDDFQFRWFIHYQLQNWSQNKITNNYNTVKQNIAKGLQGISKLLDLPLRKRLPSGKPRKTK